MAAPRSRLGLACGAVVAGGGVVIGAAAVRALVAGDGNDVAWVSLVLGLLLVAWAVAFLRLGGDGGATEAEGTETEDAERRVLRPTRLLSIGIVMTGVFVVIRLLGRPVDTAVVGALAWPAWTLVNRVLDRWIRRRRDDEDGGAAGAVTD